MTNPDPGLPSERTSLAWQRTGVASAAVSGVALLAAAHDGSRVLLAVVGLLAATGAGLGAVAAHRPARATAVTASPWTRMLAATGTTLAVAVNGMVLVVFALLR